DRPALRRGSRAARRRIGNSYELANTAGKGLSEFAQGNSSPSSLAKRNVTTTFSWNLRIRRFSRFDLEGTSGVSTISDNHAIQRDHDTTNREGRARIVDRELPAHSASTAQRDMEDSSPVQLHNRPART